MLGRVLTSGIRVGSVQAARNALTTGQLLAKPRLVQVPERGWAQVGHVICVPPRVKVSLGEKLVHFTIMFVTWLAPIGWFLTQLKVWRRKYVEV